MFQPVVPTGGIAGWRFLERTLDTQRAAFAEAPVSQRALDHFRDRIGSITTPEALVGDRMLREVALSAFGLQDDVDSIFYIKTMLEQGTRESTSLANRTADSRYREFVRAFGFDEPAGPNTQVPGFADRIVARYQERTFEVAIGETNESMRIALNARRSLPEIAAGSGSEDAKWFTVMGTPPLRKLLEGALGLPDSFGAVDLDRQLVEFKRRAQATFGTSDLSELAEEDKLSRMIDIYLVRADASGIGGTGPTSPALQLLRGF